MGTLFTYSMERTFDAPGDAMPNSQGINGLWGGQRDKLIHSVGVTGKVRFVPNRSNNGFTGIFKGADYGIIRFSSAVAPAPLRPGLGLKFLRNGMDSANLVAMPSVDGQKEWNFFANNFPNHVAAAQNMDTKMLSKKFSEATNFIQQVGLSEWCSADQNGNSERNNQFPYMVTFVPSS